MRQFFRLLRPGRSVPTGVIVTLVTKETVEQNAATGRTVEAAGRKLIRGTEETMPDTRDNTHLRREVLTVIETILQESLAARYVALHYCTGENPRKLLGEARRMQPSLHQGGGQSRGPLDGLENISDEEEFLSCLLHALRPVLDEYL